MLDASTLKDLTSTLSLMLVEDDNEARAMYEKIFNRFFKRVHSFSNGKEAFLFYQNNSFSIDLVITDISMPIMSGIELCEKIKDLDNEVKMVVLSAHDDKEKLFALINLGVDGFIVKPVSLAELQKTLFKIATIICDKKELTLTKKLLESKSKITSQLIHSKALQANSHKNDALDNDVEPVLVHPVASSLTPPISVGDDQSNLSASLHTFYEYSTEDISELREIIDDIDSIIATYFISSSLIVIAPGDLENLANLYGKYSFILQSYSILIVLGGKLFELSCALRSIYLHDIQNKIDMHYICDQLECINQSLIMFQSHVMEAHRVDPNFYDASLANDIDMLLASIIKDETTDMECKIEFF